MTKRKSEHPGVTKISRGYLTGLYFNKLKFVRAIRRWRRIRARWLPIRTRMGQWYRLRKKAIEILSRLTYLSSETERMLNYIRANYAKLKAARWFGDVGIIDTHLPELSWTTLDRYLIAMDVLAPHLLYASALSSVDNEALATILYPTDLILYKKPSIQRLAAQLMGFYTSFAKSFQHEPQLSIVGHAYRSPGKYYYAFDEWTLVVDILGARMRTKEWFDIALPPARSDVLNDAYYQWLYIREILALNYEHLAPSVLALCDQDELRVLNMVVQDHLRSHPHFKTPKLMRMDDKYLYFGLAYSRRVFPSLGTALEIPVFTEAQMANSLEPIACTPALQQKIASNIEYVSVNLQPDSHVTVDVILLPLPEPQNVSYAPLVLVKTVKPWSLVTASVRRVPRGEALTVAPLSEEDRPDWVLPLLLMAYIKPYLVSVAALLLQKKGSRQVIKEEAANAIKTALFTRICLSGLDVPRPATTKLNQLMSMLGPKDLFTDFISDRANVLAEYFYGYQLSLAKLRRAVLSQEFTITIPEKAPEKAKQYVLGAAYTLEGADDKKMLFNQIELSDKSDEGLLVVREESLKNMTTVLNKAVVMTDRSFVEAADSDEKPLMTSDYVNSVLAAGVPLVTIQYKGVYNDVIGRRRKEVPTKKK